METINTDILKAIAELSTETWERLLFKVNVQFGRQLQRIAEAPSAEDLVHEAVEDVVYGRRAWPKESVSLPVCLTNIVWSKVTNLRRKAGKTEMLPLFEETVDWEIDQLASREEEAKMVDWASATEEIPEEPSAEFREHLLHSVAQDQSLRPIVEYWLEHLNEDVTVEMIAQALPDTMRPADLKRLHQQAEQYLREGLREWKNQELQQQMLRCVKQDQELADLLRYRLTEPDAKPKKIAAALGISITTIYQAIRRLKRNKCLHRLYQRLEQQE